MTIHWGMENGLVHATPDVEIGVLVSAATARGMHVGTLGSCHVTLGDALRAEDPWFMRQLVRCVIEGKQGRITPPLAPRAAVGPDVTLFAVRHPGRAVEFTLKLEHVAAWVETTVPAAAPARDLLRVLVERGVTLAGAERQPSGSWRVLAALPRPLDLARAFGRTTPTAGPPAEPGVMLPWMDVDLERAERMAAMDTHLCVAWGVPRPGTPALPNGLERAWGRAAEDADVRGR